MGTLLPKERKKGRNFLLFSLSPCILLPCLNSYLPCVLAWTFYRKKVSLELGFFWEEWDAFFAHSTYLPPQTLSVSSLPSLFFCSYSMVGIPFDSYEGLGGRMGLLEKFYCLSPDPTLCVACCCLFGRPYRQKFLPGHS